MKHFIGGWAFGFILLMWKVPSRKEYPWVIEMGGAVFFGLAAWGLLP